MKRSAKKTVDKQPDLLPASDHGNAPLGDQLGRAVLIGTDQKGTGVWLRVHAIDPADAAAIGPGVYLMIENRAGETGLAGAIAKAGRRGDEDLCIFLNERGRQNLLEQLNSYGHVLALHEALAAQKKEEGR